LAQFNFVVDLPFWGKDLDAKVPTTNLGAKAPTTNL
jgi:hypothetical protein